MRILPLTLIALAFPATLLHAQNVGINADGAAPAIPAMLDVDVTALPANAKKGLLVPRVALTAANNNAPIGATIVNSLLVFNTVTAGTAPNAVTPGYYYWDAPANRWRRLAQDSDVDATAWRLLGNAGTVATTNFLGTTDAVALRFRTQNFDRFEITPGTVGPGGTGGRLRAFHNGLPGTPIYSFNASPAAGMYSPLANTISFSTTSLERIRILADGRVSVAAFAPFAGDQFTTFGNAVNNFAVNGYSGAGGAGVYGQSAAAASDGVFGIAQAGGLNGFPVWGLHVAATGTGVIGHGNNGAGGITVLANGSGGAFTGSGVGMFGLANGVGSFGSYGVSTNAAGGTGVLGVGNSAAPAPLATGGGGQFFGTTQATYARATLAGGVGVIGAGNNLVGNTPTGGSGGAFSGTALGAYGIGTTPASGTGVVGVGNNIGTYSTLVNGSGIAGTGLNYGVVGVATSNAAGAVGAPARAGGYFVSGTGATETFTYVAAYEGVGVPRKVMGNGTVNTVVQDLDGNNVLLSAPEAPENLFQDYGTGQLVNGRATITLDPVLAKNILVNDEHPLRVFVQLRGDCNGVFVTNESATGFEVVELMGGNSNAKFYWTVAANRANVVHSDGTIWNFAEERFPRTQGRQETIEGTSVQLEATGTEHTASESMPLDQRAPKLRMVLKGQADAPTDGPMEEFEAPIQSSPSDKERDGR